MRYADTAGDSSDYPIADAWRYRNYVIDAFNDDMPFDVFLTEQLAGDILPDANRASAMRIALSPLGFSRFRVASA